MYTGKFYFLAMLLLYVPIEADEQESPAPWHSQEEVEELFKNLSLVKTVDPAFREKLPLSYNYSLIAGYFAMPSARMPEVGNLALGFAKATPYDIYSLNFQMFSHIELVGNYRVFKGVTESGFGHLGFGDDTDRTASIKIALHQQGQGFKYLPNIALGFEDFYGSRRFYSFYICATQELLDYHLELTLGYGKGRMKGFYGGIAWTPFRRSPLKFLNSLSLIAEYDANNYKHHANEHPDGRRVKTPINIGFALNLFDFLQLKMSSLRGESIAASAVVYYNIGNSKGFFAKVNNPPFYTAPANIEPIGYLRTEQELAQEIAYAFSQQGLNLYTLYLIENTQGEKTLWLKVINTRYREELQVRDRVQHLLSTLMPADIVTTTVVVEADGVPTQAYFFRTEDLKKFREGLIGEHELQTLSPMIEGSHTPQGKGVLLYKRKKDIWTFMLRPRLITFFGSTTGKIKYTAGFIGGAEGYVFEDTYYKIQAAYNISSSLYKLQGIDAYNLSHQLIVRSDNVKYYQGQSVSLEQAYIQKGYNLGNGWFTRCALGYFEPAYGGLALESLYYPVNSSWAFGVEAAGVLKRNYHGIGFTTKTRKFNQENILKEVPFIGYQYFFDLYYEYRPWNLDFKVMVGQFLARDKGARFELSRYYPSGMRFSIWYTLTNGKDIVNGKIYHDKGIAFLIPLDFFLKKSSRAMLGYAMSAWLRDVGATAATGKKLYHTVQTERQNIGYSLE